MKAEGSSYRWGPAPPLRSHLSGPQPPGRRAQLAAAPSGGLTSEIFDLLRSRAPGAGGEIQLTDAINTQATAGLLDAVPLAGQRLDCGSVRGFLAAILHGAHRDGLL